MTINRLRNIRNPQKGKVKKVLYPFILYVKEIYNRRSSSEVYTKLLRGPDKE